MDKLWTDQETEDWLEPETREIVFPDGVKRPFTGFRLMWEIHDRLVKKGYSPEQFVKWAVQESELSGVSFDVAYRSMIAYVDHRDRDEHPL